MSKDSKPLTAPDLIFCSAAFLGSFLLFQL